MNIAITTSDATLDSSVFYDFAQSPYLLIVNVDTMAYTPVAHCVTAGSDQELARVVLEHRCEAVITGRLSEKAFDLLADDGVTRYAAGDMTAREALDAMESRQLTFIRTVDGSSPCGGGHHHGL